MLKKVMYNKTNINIISASYGCHFMAAVISRRFDE